jgi:GLPGLI family protein
MKKAILMGLALALAIGFATHAQNNNTEGLITYEEVVKFKIEMDDLSEQMQAMLPTENRSEKQLFFNEEASLYQNSKNVQSDINESSEDGGIRIMMSQPEEIYFRDLKKNTSIEQREFMTRLFLIESETEQKEWKLTGKQKMILDFPCQEAILQDSNKTTNAWFTPAIPISTGPANYAGLPGLILSIESDSGNRVIIAKTIEFKKIGTKEMQKPKKGKKVSKEKFNSIVEKKTKEMGTETGGGSMIIMEIQN